MNDAHQLLRSVIHIADTVQDRLEKSLEPSGLSLAKLGALRHLSEAGEPLPLGQLAERISCVKSNVTQLVDRLEAEGLVKRVPDPDDRRSVRAAITDEGLARCQAGLEALKQAEAIVVAHLDTSDQATLTGLLGRLK